MFPVCVTREAAGRAEERANQYQKPASKRQKMQDLAGIVPGMYTFGKGRAAQLSFDLSHKPLCTSTCPAKGKSAMHNASCEHGIIISAKLKAGYTNKGKTKKK